MAMSVQPLNGPAGLATVSTLWMRTGRSARYPVSEGVPGTPRVSSSSPSGVNFLTEWSPLSTQYTAPSGPILMLCALVKIPAPQARTNFPAEVYTST